VIATHYVDAWNAAPDDEEADDIGSRAREMLVRAGERAASLAASSAAQNAYERAIELTDDEVVQADLYERAGLMAFTGARPEAAGTHFEQAIALFDAAGETHARARVEARLAQIMWDRGRLEEGLERMDRSYQELSQEEPDADLAALAAQLGRFLFFAGRRDLAIERIESALELAESLSLPETFSQALNTKAILLVSHSRGSKDLHSCATPSRSLLNTTNRRRCGVLQPRGHAQADRYEEAETTVRDGLAFSRRVGNRYQSSCSSARAMHSLHSASGTKSADGLAAPDEWRAADRHTGPSRAFTTINVHQGRVERQSTGSTYSRRLAPPVMHGNAQRMRPGEHAFSSRRGAEGRFVCQDRTQASDEMGFTQEYARRASSPLEAAVGSRHGSRPGLLAIIESPPGRLPQFLHAQALRFRAQLAGLINDADAERLFKGAEGLFRELVMPFYLAVAELEHAEWLTAQGRGPETESLLEEARRIKDLWLRATEGTRG
jgi:tetratricopeptide (TPR) repeat protein